MRLTHVRLPVNDFHAMRLFYRDTLGLRVGFDDGENFAEVKAGGVDISLFVRHGMADASYRRLSSGAVRFVAPPKDMAEWGIRIARG